MHIEWDQSEQKIVHKILLNTKAFVLLKSSWQKFSTTTIFSWWCHDAFSTTKQVFCFVTLLLGWLRKYKSITLTLRLIQIKKKVESNEVKAWFSKLKVPLVNWLIYFVLFFYFYLILWKWCCLLDSHLWNRCNFHNCKKLKFKEVHNSLQL